MIYAILAVLGVALVYAAMQAKGGASWAPKAIVALAIAIIIVSVASWFPRGGSGADAALAEAATADEAIAREIASAFGKHLAKGNSVVVFAVPADPDARRWMLEGLEKGLEPHGLTVAALAPPMVQGEKDPRGGVGGFESVLERHPNAGGIIIYGTPEADMEDIEQGHDTDLPLAIVAQRLTPDQAIQRVKDGTATLISVVRPNIDWMAIKDVTDPIKRFHKIRIIVTPDTLADAEKALGQ